MKILTAVGNEAKVRRHQAAPGLILKITDGHIMTVKISDSAWEGMCYAPERAARFDDERFNTIEARIRYAKVRIAAMEEVLTDPVEFRMARAPEHAFRALPASINPTPGHQASR